MIKSKYYTNIIKWRWFIICWRNKRCNNSLSFGSS